MDTVSSKKPDRAAGSEAGPSEADEFEITPEMIEAGVKEYYQAVGLREPEYLVECVFDAMYEAMGTKKKTHATAGD